MNILAIRSTLTETTKPSVRGGFASRLLGRVQAVTQNLKNIVTAGTKIEPSTSAANTLTQATQNIGRFLQDRAIKTFQTYKNSSTEDKAWFLANMGMGVGAKALLLSGVATGGTSLVVAAAGGIITGGVRTIMDRARAHRNGDKEKLSQSFTRQFLMNTVSGGVISTVTFGLLSGVTSLTGLNLSDVFSRSAEKVFKLEKHGFITPARIDALLNTSPSSPIDTMTEIPIAEPTLEPVPEKPLHKKPKTLLGKIFSSKVLPSVDIQAKQVKINELTLEHLRSLIEKTTGIKPSADTTARQLAEQFHPRNPDALLNTIQKNVKIPDVISHPPIAKAPLPIIRTPLEVWKTFTLPDGTTKSVQVPPIPDLKDEYKMAAYAVQSNGLDVERSLPPEKLRAACLSDIPATPEIHQERSGIVPTTCNIADSKPFEEGEYVIIRNINEPNDSEAVKVVFVGAKTPAPEFMEEAVDRKTIPEMTSGKIGTEPR